MRPLAVAVLALSLPVAAQNVPTGVTVSTGYATGYEAGALHSEVRLRFSGAGFGLEPMASWTVEAPYSVDYGAFCVYPQGGDPGYGTCLGRSGGGHAVALGVALTYRAPGDGLPLGLDGAHVGTFAQAVVPLWQSRGQRYGVEIGADAQLSRRVRLGLDVQASRYTEFAGGRAVSVSPLVRLAVGL